MRLLADVGVSMSTVLILRERRHDVVHLREEGLQRLPDPEILRKAVAERRVILTFDLDFADLMALGLRTEPSVVIFRLRNQTPASVNPRLLEILDDRTAELEAGAVIIVEDSRYRVRRLPVEDQN